MTESFRLISHQDKRLKVLIVMSMKNQFIRFRSDDLGGLTMLKVLGLW